MSLYDEVHKKWWAEMLEQFGSVGRQLIPQGAAAIRNFRVVALFMVVMAALSSAMMLMDNAFHPALLSLGAVLVLVLFSAACYYFSLSFAWSNFKKKLEQEKMKFHSSL